MEKCNLNSGREDILAAAIKGLAGSIPIAGPMLAEIVGSIIPNQRLDRITNFLQELEIRLTSVEVEIFKDNKLAIDLFEDAAIVVSRALTEVRNKYVVVFMKSSISTDAADYDIKKKLLYILQDLTDRDIEILRSIKIRGHQITETENYSSTLSECLFGKLTEQGKIDYYAKQEVWPLHILTLERSGLLKAHREEQYMDNTNSHIDMETGLPRISFYEASKLGDVFLALIFEYHSN
jgi:hypothetical protein